ncbi:MAG TPA: 4,5-DOPA dioxygenase extradiol [Candidatus Polarisedimenticolia bacterium]|nr:4,5-DOPA dioxygenase extradiol [Candidatus Polarisedimenticolia bacterium]
MTAARMPVLFVGHGSPMNAIEDNTWSRGFQSLGRLLPTPKAILAVSAHWYLPGSFTTGNTFPETIHDFGGFPRELYEIQYPAPGDARLAKRVAKLLGAWNASVREDWGLDHGTWSVLRHMRPEADLPVVQLSIDSRAAPETHVALGRALAPLRDEGVMIIGSGNIVHNLSDAFGRMRTGDVTTPPWAARFDADVASALERHDDAFLARALHTEPGRTAHPTPDHYLPLLYAVGASGPGDAVRFPILGFDLGSLSMRTVVLG